MNTEKSSNRRIVCGCVFLGIGLLLQQLQITLSNTINGTTYTNVYTTPAFVTIGFLVVGIGFIASCIISKLKNK